MTELPVQTDKKWIESQREILISTTEKERPWLGKISEQKREGSSCTCWGRHFGKRNKKRGQNGAIQWREEYSSWVAGLEAALADNWKLAVAEIWGNINFVSSFQYNKVLASYLIMRKNALVSRILEENPGRNGKESPNFSPGMLW